MRTKAILGLGMMVGLAGCPNEGPQAECSEFEEVFVWADHDGDGFGINEPLGYKCAPGPNESTNSADCNDEDNTVYPTGEEVCDDKDNNCNDIIDEDNPKIPYYLDSDGDGYGNADEVEVVCVKPPGYVEQANDCDDTNAAVNPSQREICNDEDDDCDNLEDDDDPSVDPTTAIRYYFDSDGDGHGQSVLYVDQCDPPDNATTLSDDCNDSNGFIYPGAPEVCNNRDDDCDLLIDDGDDSIDPTSQTAWYQDVDNDGFGDPASEQRSCDKSPQDVIDGIGVFDGTDCNDNDPSVHILKEWYIDADVDGFGGTFVKSFCGDLTGLGLVDGAIGVDCNDAEPNESPGLTEICGDGYDNDCSGADTCQSCQQWLDLDPNSADGVYPLAPVVGAGDYDVYCDMTTDGGGWTLVASTNFVTLNDAASDYYSDLSTLEPLNGNIGVWDGLRDVVGNSGDIRFVCKEFAANPTFDVDLSFYSIRWYWEITTGNDSASCFNEGDGAGDDFPPARRNNLTGDYLVSGDAWNADGYLEGEDTCGDSDDFTVDFDDRGMKSNPSDGTDWGEANGVGKCATGFGENWYIFTRE